jgi:seryl-tRNA synthetase
MDEIGLRWNAANGQSSLSGPLLRLADDCDQAFRVLAGAFGAEEERHPVLIGAEALHRLDYFASFPHQATWPVCLDPGEANVKSFAAGPMVEDGEIRPTRLAPMRDVLTPAACYHVYAAHEGETAPAARHFTVRATCFRREAEYRPLTRQWSFTMREIACIGTREEVRDFVRRARELAGALCRALDVDVRWEPATDPFFQPLANPKYLMQKVAPIKEELIFGTDLAIASVNLHHDHMGEAFGLRRGDATAETGCLAFGLERWLSALIGRYGVNPEAWPRVADAAARLVGAP